MSSSRSSSDVNSKFKMCIILEGSVLYQGAYSRYVWIYRSSFYFHKASVFYTHPCLSTSGASVMSSPWSLTIAPPVDSSFLLEVRQLQQLFTGQPKRGVHHQTRLFTQRSTDSKERWQNTDFALTWLD